MRQPIDRAVFDKIVAVMQTGVIKMDGGEADLSPDQTIRIHAGKLHFDPPLRVKKAIQIARGWLGSVKVGSAIAEVVFRAATDTIYIDLIGSPVDVELYPQGGEPQPQMMTMPPEPAASIAFAVADRWEDIEEDCLTQFGCSSALMASADKRHQAQLRKRQAEVKKTSEAVRKVVEASPNAPVAEVYSSVTAILFPLLFKIFGEGLLSMLQRTVVDWLLNRIRKSPVPAGVVANEFVSFSS